MYWRKIRWRWMLSVDRFGFRFSPVRHAGKFYHKIIKTKFIRHVLDLGRLREFFGSVDLQCNKIKCCQTISVASLIQEKFRHDTLKYSVVRVHGFGFRSSFFHHSINPPFQYSKDSSLLPENQLHRHAFEIKLLPQFVFQIAHIRLLDIFGMATEESEYRSLGR